MVNAKPAGPIFLQGKIERGSRDAFEAWREINAPMFRFDAASPDARKTFAARFDVADFGDMYLSATTADASRLERDDKVIAKTGADRFVIQFYRQSGYVMQANGTETRVGAGDFAVIDLTRSVNIYAPSVSNLAVGISRNVLAPLLAEPDAVHGRILRGETQAGWMLRTHLDAMHQRAPRATGQDAQTFRYGTAALVATILGRSANAKTTTRAAMRTMLRQAICRRIEVRLTDPGLDPASLMREFNISRPTLYRLFEELGGVQHYIQERRLAAAFRDLCNPAMADRHIGTIFYRYGFTNHTVAGRAFRAAYGMTPGEARMEAREKGRPACDRAGKAEIALHNPGQRTPLPDSNET